jgi:hypothetical protein
LKEKDNAHTLWKRSKSPSDYSEFTKVRNNFKKIQKAKHADYVLSIEQSVRQNTKRLFSYSQSKQKSGTTPSSMTYNDSEADNAAGIAELFSEHF